MVKDVEIEMGRDCEVARPKPRLIHELTSPPPPPSIFHPRSTSAGLRI